MPLKLIFKQLNFILRYEYSIKNCFYPAYHNKIFKMLLPFIFITFNHPKVFNTNIKIRSKIDFAFYINLYFFFLELDIACERHNMGGMEYNRSTQIGCNNNEWLYEWLLLALKHIIDGRLLFEGPI